jgi:PIN domain nuclease of toxin-antitoxin system
VILLDTCVLLWLAADPSRLSKLALDQLSEHRGRLFVSAISAFEIGIKHRKGKLELPMPPDDWYEEALEFHGLAEIPVSGRIASRSTLLPSLHSDPCDRILVATAQQHGVAILTPDPLIQAYPEIRWLW